MLPFPIIHSQLSGNYFLEGLDGIAVIFGRKPETYKPI